MSTKLIRLYGGHRNRVFRTDGKVKIVWKDGFKREKQIREGVLLENFVAVHTDIKSRMLVDKSKPVEEDNGELVTYFNYADGEIRYPWNLKEIASAAKLLGKLHLAINPSLLLTPYSLLHLDFARGNVLFLPGTSDATGIIDFETTAKGPVEQELGRTLSFILVDSPINSVFPARHRLSPKAIAGGSIQYSVFISRWNIFLTNYSLPFRKDKMINWTLRYLTDEGYGDLNFIRDKVVSWLRDNNLAIQQFNN